MSSNGLIGCALVRPDLFGVVYISFAVVETVVSWEKFSCESDRACPEPIHIWLLITFFLIVLIRVSHICAASFADRDSSLVWRPRIVMAPCHCQAFFLMIFVYYVFWVFKGTIWYYELLAQDPMCFDPREFSIWIVFMYAVIVFYVTLGMVGVMSLLREQENESQYQALLEQYGEAEVPPRVSGRHWEEQGLSPHAIMSQPVRDISTEEDSVHVCSICIEDIRNQERVRTLRCGHIFHIKCIDEWFMQRAECPNCNRSCRLDSRDLF